MKSDNEICALVSPRGDMAASPVLRSGGSRDLRAFYLGFK